MTILVTPRVDRSTFFVVWHQRNSIVREVDASITGSPASLVAEVQCGGSVVQFALSTTTTSPGQTFLGVLLATGLLEVWDVTVGRGPYTLHEAVQLLPHQMVPLPRHNHLLTGSSGLSSPLFFHAIGAFSSAGSNGGSRSSADGLLSASGSSTTSNAAAQTLLHIVQLLGGESASNDANAATTTLGTQKLTALDASRKKCGVVALACHESRPLLCVAFTDGVLHLYDTSRFGEAGNGSGGGTDEAASKKQRQRQSIGASESGQDSSIADDEDDEDDEDDQEEGFGGLRQESVQTKTLDKAARKLLLPPLGAFKFPQLQGNLSCICLNPSSGLILAGSSCGQVAIWSTNKLLRQASKHGGSSALMSMHEAVPPVQHSIAMPGSGCVTSVEFLQGPSPFVIATVRREEGGVGATITRMVLLAILPEALPLVARGPALSGWLLGFQRRYLNVLLADDIGSCLKFAPLGEVLSSSTMPSCSSLPALLSSPSSLPRLVAMTPSQLSCATFLGQEGPSCFSSLSSADTMIYSIQSRLILSVRSGKKDSSEKDASLVFKSLLMARPLYHLQKKAGPTETASGFLLPSCGSDLRSLITKLNLNTSTTTTVVDDKALLVPHRLIPSPDGATIVVLFQVISALTPPQSSQQDGASSFTSTSLSSSFPSSLVFVVLRSVPPAKKNRSLDPSLDEQEEVCRSFTLTYAGLATDSVFLSSHQLALLSRQQAPAGGTGLTILEAEGNPSLPTTAWKPQMQQQQEQLVEDLSGTMEGSVFVEKIFAGAVAVAAGSPGQGSNALSSKLLLYVLRRTLAGSSFQAASSRHVLVLAQAGRLRETVLATPSAGGGHILVLHQQETVLEAVWQCGLSQDALLAVLTSQRVLILSPELVVVTAAEMALPPASGLLWLGPTPLVVSPDGRVSYLCVDPKFDGLPADAELRPLCALDQSHAGPQLTLIAALPDRLIYGAQAADATGRLRVLTRPLLPFEALVVGFLALPRLVSSQGKTSPAVVGNAVQTVLARYGPGWLESDCQQQQPQQKPSFGYGLGEGLGANAGATAWTCAMLTRARLFRQAAAVAGLQVNGKQQQAQALPLGAEPGSQEYSPRPWLPVDVKAGLMARTLRWREALREALGEDAVVQEYALHLDTLQSAAMPLRFRRLSQVLATLGQEARDCGQAGEALRLLDVAGEDDDVVDLLLIHALGMGFSEDGWNGLLQELFAAKADPHLVAWVQAAKEQQTKSVARELQEETESSPAFPATLAAAKVVTERLSNQAFPFASQQRRTTLLSSLPEHQALPRLPLASVSPPALALASPPSVGPVSNSSGPPRPRRMQRLLLGCLEEWLGRAAPEGLLFEEREDGAHGEGDGGTGGEKSEQHDWVKGVGEGREEEDNVVLYWRFNEPLPPVEDVSVGIPFRLAGGDLSQYGHSLDLMLDHPKGLVFEHSNCPIDLGDGGKVRLAMDAVWSLAEVTPTDAATSSSSQLWTVARGLTTTVPRGSALDIGPYYGPLGQIGRSRLTVELWVQRPSPSPFPSPSSETEVLVARSTAVTREKERTDNNNNNAPTSVSAAAVSRLWALGASPEGALLFWMGSEATGRGQSLQTAADLLQEGKWSHVAFTLETKGGGGGNGRDVTVVLFVGGKEVASTSGAPLKLPSLTEGQLRSTFLEIGPNLRGHRMTELRMWASARSAEDLYDNRESYLKLAEKRKKLTFKIKTGVAPPVVGSSSGAAVATTMVAGTQQDSQGNTTGVGTGTSTASAAVGGALPVVPLFLSQPGGTVPLRRRTAAAGRETATSSPDVIGPIGGGGGSVGSGSGLLMPLPPPGSAEAAGDTNIRARSVGSRRGSPALVSGGKQTTAAPPPVAKVPTPPPIMVGWAKGFETEWDDDAASDSAMVVRPPSAAISTTVSAIATTTTTAKQDHEQQLAQLTVEVPPLQPELLLLPMEWNVDPSCILRDVDAPSFSLEGRYLCLRAETAAASSSDPPDASKKVTSIVVLTLANPWRSKAPARLDRYNFKAESAILVGTGVAGQSPPSPSLIACYKVEAGGAGVLQVFDLDQRRRVAQQPVQTRVLFWRWLSRQQVALVTQRAVFTWNVVGSSGTPPVKVFARQDTTTSTSALADQVVVRDYHHAAGGEWGVLTSTEGRGEEEGTQGVKVQFHHLLRHHFFLTESGTGLVDGNVGYCGDRLYFGLLYQQSSSPSPSITSTSPPSDSATFILQVSVLQEGAQESLTNVARLPVPGAAFPLSRTRPTRSWVLFPPGGKRFMGVLLGEGGLLYTYDPADGEGLLQARGSVFPSGPSDGETRVVREVCWDEETGGLLVLEATTLSVFRVTL